MIRNITASLVKYLKQPTMLRVKIRVLHGVIDLVVISHPFKVFCTELKANNTLCYVILAHMNRKNKTNRNKNIIKKVHTIMGYFVWWNIIINIQVSWWSTKARLIFRPTGVVTVSECRVKHDLRRNFAFSLPMKSLSSTISYHVKLILIVTQHRMGNSASVSKLSSPRKTKALSPDVKNRHGTLQRHFLSILYTQLPRVHFNREPCLLFDRYLPSARGVPGSGGSQGKGYTVGKFGDQSLDGRLAEIQ